MRPRAWAPILAFLGLNLAGYLAARAFAAPRPYVVNIDYGLILIAAALVRPLGRPVHLAALFLGLLLSVTIDVCAIASAPLLECLTRLGDYLAFIDLWPWRVLAPWFIAVILLAGAISWMTRAAGPRDVVGLALLIVALAAADVAIRLPPLRSRTNLLSTSTGMLLRGHLAFAPSTDDVIAKRFKIEAPDTLMSISMESLGLYQDPSAQERLISESLVRPLAGRYDVAYVTTHGFGGLTLQGEFRELCGLSLKRPSWSSTEMPALRNCLPNALMRRGYATEAFHGNTGRFYGRSRTYPYDFEAGTESATSTISCKAAGSLDYNGQPMRIFIDADACPVKDEVYKVAARYGIHTLVVSNSFIQIPVSSLIERRIVDAGPDVADDWIAGEAQPGDIVVTNDIPLAERALNAGAAAIAPNGRAFTADSIGQALAQRALMEHIRSTGEITGGPRPFERNDRSRFLQALDEAVQRSRRARR
jgi:uncharacterized protein YaiI (UPF0178 family)